MHTRWFFLFALFLTACIGPLDPNNSEYIEIREVTVGPALARCYGVGEQTCMVVDGSLFYDSIEGFNFEGGYNYRLRIGKYDPYDGKEPPQDAGQYSYRLLEQIEKTPAPSAPTTLSVGPTRIKCEQRDDFCLLINGASYYDIITNFDYEAGYHYTLNANQYSDGRYMLTEIASKTEVTGTEEEITLGAHRTPCNDNYPVYCNVVNGEAFLGEIVNFQPRHNYSYRLRVEQFDMFSSSTTPPSSNIPTYGYRWLETLEQSTNN